MRVPPHRNRMAVRDGPCLRRAAGPSSFAGFEMHIKQVSMASYKPPKRTFRHTESEWQWGGRTVPSNGSWSWLTCWLWNAYKTSFNGQLQASKTYVPPLRNSMAVRDGPCLRRAAGRSSFAGFEMHIKQVSVAKYKPPNLKRTFCYTETAWQ